MKRDMDLIRDILLQIEKQDINMFQYESIAVEGHKSVRQAKLRMGAMYGRMRV